MMNADDPPREDLCRSTDLAQRGHPACPSDVTMSSRASVRWTGRRAHRYIAADMGEIQTRTTRLAAYGLVVDDGHILLCRISPKIPHLSGQWTLPGGGVHFGEDPVDAMVREVHEETGLAVATAGLADVNAITGNRDGTPFHGVRIVYHTRQLGGALRNETDGTTDLCQWWRLEAAGGIPLVDLARTGLAIVEDAASSRGPQGTRTPEPPSSW